jgi:hypothetical protein
MNTYGHTGSTIEMFIIIIIIIINIFMLFYASVQ